MSNNTSIVDSLNLNSSINLLKSYLNPEVIIVSTITSFVTSLLLSLTKDTLHSIINLICNFFYILTLKMLDFFNLEYRKHDPNDRTFMFTLKNVGRYIDTNGNFISFKTGKYELTKNDKVDLGFFCLKNGTMVYIASCRNDKWNGFRPKAIHVISKKDFSFFDETEYYKNLKVVVPTNKLVHIYRHNIENGSSKYGGEVSDTLLVIGTGIQRRVDRMKILDYVSPGQKFILDDIVNKRHQYHEQDSIYKSDINLICGQPGLGKSSLAHLLAHYTNSVEIVIKGNTTKNILNTIDEFANAKLSMVVLWDEFDTFLDEYVLNEKNVNKISGSKNAVNEHKISTDHQLIKKQITDLFDDIYQYDNVSVILTTNKTKDYFANNPNLEFITRSMRLSEIYEMVQNSEAENRKIFKDFLEIFKILNWNSRIENSIQWTKLRLCNLYSIFNYSFGNADKLIMNLRNEKILE
jgi:energy-coupling factor transporter ATP-binding protein EcfA2